MVFNFCLPNKSPAAVSGIYTLISNLRINVSTISLACILLSNVNLSYKPVIILSLVVTSCQAIECSLERPPSIEHTFVIFKIGNNFFAIKDFPQPLGPNPTIARRVLFVISFLFSLIVIVIYCCIKFHSNILPLICVKSIIIFMLPRIFIKL